MSNEEMRNLFQRTKEFAKSHNLRVITPVHIRPVHPARLTTCNKTGLVFVDYLSILGN